MVPSGIRVSTRDRELELAVGDAEDVGLQRLGVGVAHDQLGERVALDLAQQVEAREPGQVVEPVAILQLEHLLLEHKAEGGSEHAAEQPCRLGEATDPQVDPFETGLSVRPAAGAVQERLPIARSLLAAVHQQFRSGAAPSQPTGDAGMGAVRGNEVDQRVRVLEVEPEIGPAGVRPQRGVTCAVKQLPAELVERGHASLASPGDVDRREVERQPE
jgi:hypothetical protein